MLRVCTGVCVLWLRRAINISTTHDHDNDFSFSFNCTLQSAGPTRSPSPSRRRRPSRQTQNQARYSSRYPQAMLLNERGQFLMQFMQIRFN